MPEPCSECGSSPNRPHAWNCRKKPLNDIELTREQMIEVAMPEPAQGVRVMNSLRDFERGMIDCDEVLTEILAALRPATEQTMSAEAVAEATIAVRDAMVDLQQARGALLEANSALQRAALRPAMPEPAQGVRVTDAETAGELVREIRKYAWRDYVRFDLTTEEAVMRIDTAITAALSPIEPASGKVVAELIAAAKAFDADLSEYCDGEPRDRLRAALLAAQKE